MTQLTKLDDQPVATDITLCEGLFVRTAVFQAGSYIPQHSHTSPHLSIVAHGAARVWADGALLGDYHAPAGVVIRAHVKHTFLALEDGTAILCVHRVVADGLPETHDLHEMDVA